MSGASGVTGSGATDALTYWTGAGTIGATTSPTVSYITATSTVATSTFGGGVKAQNINIGGQELLFNESSGATSSVIVGKASSVGSHLFIKAGDSTLGGGGARGGNLTLEAGHSGGIGSVAGGDVRLISGNQGGPGGRGAILFGSGAFSGAITEWGRFSRDGYLGIGTSSPYASLSVGGQAVAQFFTADTSTATSTFHGGVNLAKTAGMVFIGPGGSASPGVFVLDTKNTAGNPTCTNGGMYYNSNESKAYVCVNSAWQAFGPRIHTTGFTYATSTWSGTTTIFMAPAASALTMTEARCETNTGTLGVSLYDGSNRANYIPTASTTVNTFAYSSNHTFTENESIRVDIGTPVSSPTKIACRFQYTYTSDL